MNFFIYFFTSSKCFIYYSNFVHQIRYHPCFCLLLITRYCRLVIDIEPDKRILLAFHEFTLEGIDLFSPTKTEEDVCLCGVLVEVGLFTMITQCNTM